MRRRLLLLLIVLAVALPSLHGQAPSPPPSAAKPEAIYKPAPVYRPEWAKQRLAGKGVVLVTIDQATGNVTGAKIFESTGNPQLDGAALQAYTQWRFKPGSVPQLKIPFEFKSGPPPRKDAPSSRRPPAFGYIVLVLFGLGAGMLIARRRRRNH